MGQESREAADTARAVRVRAMQLAQSVEDQVAAVVRARGRIALLSHALLSHATRGGPGSDVAERVRRTVDEARAFRFEVGTEVEAQSIAEKAARQMERLESLAGELGIDVPK